MRKRLEAGMLDLDAIMRALSTRRPLFHSEADFQHALAWEIQLRFPDASIRLERPVRLHNRAFYVDIWLKIADKTFVLELKYKTRKLAGEIGGEPYFLLLQGAQDSGRYDFIKDIQRLEEIAFSDPSATGYAIFLTNDSSYWTPSRKTLVPADHAFRLDPMRELHGTLSWTGNVSPGTVAGREGDLRLDGEHLVDWRDYSSLDVDRNGIFRYLLLQILQRNK
jgi:hypothetical protein